MPGLKAQHRQVRELNSRQPSLSSPKKLGISIRSEAGRVIARQVDYREGEGDGCHRVPEEGDRPACEEQAELAFGDRA
jgi:hypothetical protein